MLETLHALTEISACIDGESTCTGEEMAARNSKYEAWSAGCRKQIWTENPHRLCAEQLEKKSGVDEFQACDVCKNAHDEHAISGECITSSLVKGTWLGM